MLSELLHHVTDCTCNLFFPKLVPVRREALPMSWFIVSTTRLHRLWFTSFFFAGSERVTSIPPSRMTVDRLPLKRYAGYECELTCLSPYQLI